jgi:histidine ammonia-lyase
MAVVITGKNLKIEDVYRVAYGFEKVKLHQDSLEKIKKCRNFIEKKIDEKESRYWRTMPDRAC